MSIVRWRDGVFLEDTPIWCDALRTRDICFVSAADAIKPTRHGQVIATSSTLAMLSGHGHGAGVELSAPLGRPFTLGTLRLELFGNGHGVGGAGLALTQDSRRLIYAGSICPRGHGLGGAADVRAGDAVVVFARHAPSLELPMAVDECRELVDFCREAIHGSAAIVVTEGVLAGIDVAAELARAGLAVFATRAIHHRVRRLMRGGLGLPTIRRARSTGLRAGEVLVAPRAQTARLPTRPAQTRVALVSGDPNASASLRLDVDRRFAWSHNGDYNDLMNFVDATGARDVFVTGPSNDAVARAADGKNRRFRAIGPPRQLTLL